MRLRMKLVSTVLLALACVINAAPADAVLVDVTWTGTIEGGNDRTGTFGGTAGEDFDLAGFSYTATHRFDTELGELILAGGGTIELLVGGSSYGSGSVVTPAVSSSITINGTTLPMGGEYYASYQRRNEAASGGFPGFGLLETLVQQSAPGGGIAEIFHRLIRSDDQLLSSISLVAPYSRILGPGDVATNANFQALLGGNLAAANLSPDSVTIAPFVVPEPSTATLALAGLAALGGMARGRKR